MGVIQRARERGLAALGDEELLSILLGVRLSVAARALEHYGGLAAMAELGCALGGEGERATMRVAASAEIARRAWRARARDVRIWNAPAVAEWGAFLVALEREELWLIALDAKNMLKSACCVAAGGISGLHCAVRDPLRYAIRAAASAFVLVHNHPSGDPTPSEDDVRFTEHILDASQLIGTPLVDHVVVARNGFASVMPSAENDEAQNSASCAPA